MNTNTKSRSLVAPVLGLVAILAAASLGIYFWSQKEEPPHVETKNPPGADKKPEPEKKPPQGGNGVTPPKVQPVRYEPAPVSLAAATEFLHSGPNPVQVGLDPKALDARRAAALRGLVFKKEKEPFPGVHVSIQNQPRYGVGHSRNDGSYDMVVNGGGLITVGFTRDGYLPVWRQTAVPWLDYTWLPPVVMTTVDSQVTPIQSADKKLQIARANPVKDKDGARQTTLLFQGGTTAAIEMPDGSKKPLATLNVRATEYTVGEDGRDRMPAPLPGHVGYTYCVELSADEAAKAGAKSVRFSKPVYHYVENFLDFPVGIPVPTGYFDPQKGVWIAAQSGRIIRILAIQNDLADLDIDGKGQPANAKALQSLNVSDDERKVLAQTYRIGVSLWRVPIPHFSIWACNWAFGPPAGALAPKQPAPAAFEPKDAIKPVREAVSLPGVAWKLHYHSDRTPGAMSRRTMRIPLSDKTLPDGVKAIQLEVYVAGRRFAQQFAADPDQVHTFTWDGEDAFGRFPQGSQLALVRIGYAYDGVYRQTARFGDNGDAQPIKGSRTRQAVVLWQEHQFALGGLDARSLGLGGWSFEAQHAYDPVARILYLGNGDRHAVKAPNVRTLDLTIATVAGGGAKADLGDGGPALLSRLDDIKYKGFSAGSPPRNFSTRGLAIAPDGTLFITDANERVRRIHPGGTITTIAGGGTKDLSEGPPTELQLQNPCALALAPDGSLYIAEAGYYCHRIRRLGPDGILTTVAGIAGERRGFSGDGGPARQAKLHSPTGLAVAADGTLYIADQLNHRIRCITPDGIINTIAGTGKEDYNDQEKVATRADLFYPTSLALGPDGSLYFSDTGNYVIRRINRAGMIETVAGTLQPSGFGKFGGDGGPARKAKFNEPTGLAVAADGTLYIADTYSHRIRTVGPDGIVRTLAGSATPKEKGNFAGDQGPPQLAKLSHPTAVALGPNGSLYFYDASFQRGPGKPPYQAVKQRIRRISSPGGSEIAIPSPDGKEVFMFNALGQHLETRDAATKKVRIRLEYDKAGRVAKIADDLGKAVTVERDAKGRAHALLAHTGQKTALEMNDNGYLATLTNAAGATTRMSYSPDGWLKEVTHPALSKSGDGEK